MMKFREEEFGEIDAFIGEKTSIEGTLTFEETVRIDGKVKGKIISQHSLVVGENARVDGEIDVATVSVSGEVRGKIKAKKRLELLPKARVYADIISPCLRIEEGALFQGTCHMETPRGEVSLPGIKFASIKVDEKG
jgi:cytoskeletal protein CcmA (bactofilin family)